MPRVASTNASSPITYWNNCPSPPGLVKAGVGGVDLNKPRMGRLVDAIIALSSSCMGFSGS